MKFFYLFILLILPVSSLADSAKFCDEIERFRIWANGSDTYGIWVEYKTNPEACPGGFFIQHLAENKNYVMSFLLAEKAQNNRVCIQAITDDMNSNRCRLNYAYNP